MTPEIQFTQGGLSAGEVVTSAWELVKRRYWMYVGASVIAFIMTNYMYCISWAVMGPVLGGLYMMILKDERGEDVEFGMMFKGFERFVPLMVAGLVYGVPQIIGAVVGLAINFSSLMIQPPAHRGDPPDMAKFWAFFGTFMVIMLVLLVFSMAWFLVMYFVIPLTAEHELPLGDAVKISAKAAMANIGFIILTGILLMLVMILGMLLCGIGVVFISFPMLFATNALAYRRVFPRIEDTRSYTPPPPGEYGFGQA